MLAQASKNVNASIRFCLILFPAIPRFPPAMRYRIMGPLD